jgi:hypothetical protein
VSRVHEGEPCDAKTSSGPSTRSTASIRLRGMCDRSAFTDRRQQPGGVVLSRSDARPELLDPLRVEIAHNCIDLDIAKFQAEVPRQLSKQHFGARSAS